MRRALAVGIAAVGAAALLATAGCGNSTAAAGGSKGSDGTVTLQWQMWSSGSDEAAQLKHLADLVHRKYPKIRIQLQTTPFKDYFTKLQTQLSANQAPCLVSMQSLRLGAFTDSLVPLDDLMKQQGFKAGEWDAGALKALQDNGKQLSLPMGVGSMLMYYNKDAFAAAGVPEPKPGWTVADFERDAKALTSGTRKGFALSISDQHWLSMALTYDGARPVDGKGQPTLDTPAMQKALTWYSGLAKRKVASVPASSADLDWGENQFVSGNAAMAADGFWNLGTHTGQAKFRVGVTTLPAGPGGSHTYSANSGYGIARSCSYQKEAYQALSVITGPQAAQYLAEHGRALPARLAQQPAYETFLTKQFPKGADTIRSGLAALRDSEQQSVPLRTTKNWDEVTKLFGQYLIQAYTGAQDPKSTLTTIQQQAKRGA
ncbi:ABC transporter substrate-binding protein [Actinocatenispora rupis]|uniref:Sugar ABC transporter substrate-binding protein n=1 Tax=Actinocatenispora rupis TaxID=519421 RepID=A0A8J3J8R5_9ACTN|nr:sugar ABC transporter substrate-binding protein [Actinocatenispora rupis]GID13786.1 sugar ABC transporter substrate-binding protein [Actinocatenispora rupis]